MSLFRQARAELAVVRALSLPGTPAALALREPEPAPALPAVAPVSAPAAAPVAATDADIRLARQKANYCHAVYSLSRETSVSLQDACTAVATRAEEYPDLVKGGKGGASMLAGSRAWSNYRAWTAKLGKLGRAPNVDNWRELLPKYTGSREYVRPGAEEFWVVFARLFENQNRLELSKAYEMAARVCQPMRLTLPTVDQVRHYYKHHRDQKELIIAREGEEVFRNTVADYIRRNAFGPDEAWHGDHHVFDFAVRAWDQDRGAWKAVRPWLTAWFCPGTSSFVGWVIRTITPNRDSIERALRDALAKNGNHPPVSLYIDNGKDYKAMGFARTKEDDQRLDSVAGLLGCRVKFAQPYNARAKIIERAFREVCAGFSKVHPSYRGNCPANRPEDAADYWGNPESLPDLSTVTAQFAAWLATFYHSQPSDAKGLEGKTPNQARANFPRPRPALDPVIVHRAFLREQGTRQISRGGVVRVAGREYRSDELYTLLGNVPEVLVKLDPDDVSTAWIFHPDGREIGPAREVKGIAPMLGGDATTEQIEDLREGLKRQRIQIREAKAGSAGARALGRFRTGATTAAEGIFGEGPAPLPAPATARGPRAPKPVVDLAPAEDTAALDDALTALTASRLANRSHDDLP